MVSLRNSIWSLIISNLSLKISITSTWVDIFPSACLFVVEKGNTTRRSINLQMCGLGSPPCNAPSARWPLYLQRNFKHSRFNHNLSILPFNTYQCTDQVDFFKTIDTYLTWVHGTEYWLLSTEYCILGLDTEYWALSSGNFCCKKQS